MALHRLTRLVQAPKRRMLELAAPVTYLHHTSWQVDVLPAELSGRLVR